MAEGFKQASKVNNSSVENVGVNFKFTETTKEQKQEVSRRKS